MLGDIRRNLDEQNTEYQKQIDMLKEELKEFDDVPVETEMFFQNCKVEQLSNFNGDIMT